MSFVEIDPKLIRPNLDNPRLHFPEEQLTELARSIDEQGVLVPISVYEEPGDDGTKYVILDGERRWICALRLNLETIPAWIIPKPNDVQNLLTMFNIHMVRQPWDHMPTAWALKKLIDRTGIQDVKELARLTGLSEDTVRQYLIVLKQPLEYQQMIDEGLLPIQFFVELDQRVIRPLKQKRPKLFEEIGEQEIVQGFVEKRLAGNLPDIVDLRKVRQIIDVAAKEADLTDEKLGLDHEIVSLVRDKNRTIEETYENTVGLVVETEAFVRQCERLPQRLIRLLAKNPSKEEFESIKNAIEKLIADLQKTLNDYESSSEGR